MATIPPGTALDENAFERLEALVELFQAATRQLQRIERQLRSGTYRRTYLRARINEALRITSALVAYRDGVASGSVVDWAREALPESYQYGAGLAVRDLRAQLLTPRAGAASIHTRVVAAVMDRFLTDATQVVVQLQGNVIRAARVVLEQAGFGVEIAEGIIGGLPRRTVSREIARTLRQTVNRAVGTEVDITTVDVGGRRFRVEYWAEMHARTELARASTAGTRVLSAANGVRHVQITSHAHEPCICTPFEGRIFALDEGDPRFPHVSVLPNGGCPLHPNCVHREAPAVIELLESRGEVSGRDALPRDFSGLDVNEIARLVRENRDQLRRYSMRRAGWLPTDFRLRRAA